MASKNYCNKCHRKCGYFDLGLFGLFRLLFYYTYDYIKECRFVKLILMYTFGTFIHPDSEVVVLDSIVLIKKDESTIQ